jgi:hypothetical protein
MRNNPEHAFDVQTIGAPPEYWIEVINPGVPHKGQASTATKLAVNDPRRQEISSRKAISPGTMSEIEDWLDKWSSVGKCSPALELGVSRGLSRADSVLGFRCLLLCFATS